MDLARFRSAAWLLALPLAVGLHAAAETTGLIDAAKRGDASAVRALIGTRANVNAADPDGTTALHWAVRAGDRPTTELLLRAGARANAVTRYGVTPLWLAATNGDDVLVGVLLKAGADVHARGPAGETILMAAARTGRPAAVGALLERGADVNAVEPRQQQNALMWAAVENHAEVVRALVARGADVNTASKVLVPPEWKWATTGMVSTPLPRGGWTPLMYAARQGALEAATVLADATGANLDLRDPDGTTALNFAILNVHYDLAGMLLDKGADPNVADDTGTGPLYAAVDMHTIPADLVRPAPVLSDRLGAADIVRTLLARGADPNVRLKRMPLGRVHQSADPSFGEGSTPLMRAAKSNDLTVMRLLLDNGADPTLTQKDHTNALMIEAAGGAQPSVYPTDRPVTEAGALDGLALLLDRGVDIDAFNGNGQTALHLAAARGADLVVKLLASRGATLDGRNKQGYTAAEVALGSGRSRPGQNRPRTFEKTAALLGELAASAAAPRAAPSSSRSAPTASVQSPSPIWAGIFTPEQVARGKVAFQGNCSRCHRDDLSGDEGIALNGERYQTLGPALKGETFYKNWGHGSVNRLIRKVRDAMPPDFQSIIDDSTKADVVAFVLHENGFPVGSADLPRDAGVLEGIQIVRQQADVVPNFALVQVAGCLQPGPANRWTLSAATEPTLATEGPITAADLTAARGGSPGPADFLLLNTASFGVDAHRAQKMAAKGLLYRDAGQDRLTLTALQPTGSACVK